MKLGITGSQTGTTIEQITFLEIFLASLIPLRVIVDEVHHGDCIGADDEVSTLIKERFPKTKVIIHPPIDPSKRAFQKNYSVIHLELPYLSRNRVIVRCCDTLLAFPNTEREILRSGTWVTVRFARSLKKEVIVFYPSGDVVIN